MTSPDSNWQGSRLTGLCLAALACVGCKPSASLDEPEPQACPEPPPAAIVEASPEKLSPALVHGAYAYEFSPEGDNLMGETVIDFVGDLARFRVRYLDRPEGTSAASSYATCEAEVEVPIRWTATGFRVEYTLTVAATRGDFTRGELEPTADGSRRSNTNKHVESCWMTVLEGEYVIYEVDSATTRGRPKSFRLVEPDGKENRAWAHEPPSESDFVRRIDEYFWHEAPAGGG
ncbi:hypothetical protein [Pseudenhygromyxa sp. WMMC2535]|uniref:hypothetical protein n=1 Tax=Pseudenhygromyxa sp. WMMC2535 TaxID=2712867 RepID=UPI0020D0C24A|nr:hypothetical protein [Pseudenhygromyxa sp. WMMC2535]